MPFGLGVGEMLVIFAILLLVFGAKRLPELGGALGRGIREFKSSVRDIEGEVKQRPGDSMRELNRSQESPASTPPQQTTAPPPASEPRSE